jgi:G patch domain-containing protein 1
MEYNKLKILIKAFTGGFEAGYKNTVGSKEGFTPKTFLSSRTDRAKHKP